MFAILIVYGNFAVPVKMVFVYYNDNRLFPVYLVRILAWFCQKFLLHVFAS